MKNNFSKTPINDFIEEYSRSSPIRLHMPGHKGKNFIGFENSDVTEIDGADSLYAANGIIAESEKNASEIFGCKTFYSTEGSSLAIRAMMRLIDLYAREKGKMPFVLAGRNAHSVFLSSAITLGIKVDWIYPDKGNYLFCDITAERLDGILSRLHELPVAVYITSPDYLGNISDVNGLSKICKKYGVILAVDNAHGAYLKFLSPSLHPIDLGADICADSAHKTLPCITGSAYLHIADDSPLIFLERAKSAMALFGSTSPSYLILRSLDKLNALVFDGYAEKIRKTAEKVETLKAKLMQKGYKAVGDEKLKITIKTIDYGYTGKELNAILRSSGIYCEFYDDDFLVLMFSPENDEKDMRILEKTLLSISRKPPINELFPDFYVPEKITEVFEAAKKPSEKINVENAVGRIISEATIKCPPAVSVIVGGELVDERVKALLVKYGIDELYVVK